MEPGHQELHDIIHLLKMRIKRLELKMEGLENFIYGAEEEDDDEYVQFEPEVDDAWPPTDKKEPAEEENE